MTTFGPSLTFLLFKRALDFTGAWLGILLTAPVTIFCALWILAMDGRPVLYSQWRVGQDGWLFRIHKFRTMAKDAERGGEAKFAIAGDPRIIPGCAWMRKSHADELPQLWNILRGKMSLVGPRPERPEIIAQMRTQVPGLERRLAGRPGLTGLAQIRNGYSNDVRGLRRKLAYDIRYLRRPSVWADLRLLLQTLPRLWDQMAM
ncbi:MAG: sugar transferase [Phycisphaeraceae bacterium]|nr:sugar transferase [Phycisphaeraceae bacterium]